MTDKELKAQALRIKAKGYIYWYDVSQLEEKAQSEETRQYIHSIAMEMYHTDEASCGIL